MRRYASTFVLLLTLSIGEMHSFWTGDTTTQNWILKTYRPMITAWNVKFVSIQACFILYFGAWLLYRENHVNRTTVKAFFWFAIFDTIVYFYNYKIRGFGQAYYWFAAIWLLIYWIHGKNKRANEAAN